MTDAREENRWLPGMFRVPEDDPHDIAPLVGQVSVETVKIAAGLPGEFAA